MDTPPIETGQFENDVWYLTPEQCEALGLIQTDPQPTTSNDKPSMTREWGLTDEQCISWEHELQQALDTIPSSPESWLDNMLNDLPDELEEIGKDSAYSGHATSAHERTTQPTGLGAHKKTIRMDDPPDDIHPYDDSDAQMFGPSGTRKSTYSSSYDEPLSKTIKLVPYSDSEDDAPGPSDVGVAGKHTEPPCKTIKLVPYSDSEDDAPRPSDTRKSTYSSSYDKPLSKTIKLVPYSDSEDDGGSPKKTIGTDNSPPQLMDYSAQPTTTTAIPSMAREWGLADVECALWEHKLQQALDTIPSSPESWFDNMLNDLPDELENFGKDSAYLGHTTSTHEKDTEYATQPRGLGAHKKTIRIDDSPPQLIDYSDSEDGVPPSPNRLRLVDYSDTKEKGGVIPPYDMNKLIGRHIFGRHLLRQYNGTTATDEVYEL